MNVLSDIIRMAEIIEVGIDGEEGGDTGDVRTEEETTNSGDSAEGVRIIERQHGDEGFPT